MKENVNPKTKINSILNAAIENAFDDCKNTNEILELIKNIIEKMTIIYWTRKNITDGDKEIDCNNVKHI
jgi:hypothetical protein